MKSAARFIFENSRIVRVKELPRVCFLTVMVQAGKFPDYQEVVLFTPPAFPLEEGAAVTVTGDIQKKKPKDGGNKWETEFIGRNVVKGDDAKAPRPRQSAGGPAPSRNAPEIDPNDDVDF